MGPALWVFLWLWREANLADGEWFGEVRNSRPIRLEEIAGALGVPLRTVERHIALLRKGEYLETWRSRPGIEVMVFLWDPEVEKGAAEDEAKRQKRRLENDSPTAKNGGSRGGTAVNGKIVSDGNELDKKAKNGGSGARTAKNGGCGGKMASQPPKMAVLTPLRLPHKDLDITRSPSSPGESSYVPAAIRRIKTNAPVETDREPERGAVVAGNSPETPGLAQARKLLNRVEAWERPDLTRTLTEKLERLEPWQVEQAFEFVWRRHRHRNKGLASPAAWWASMLARAADELVQAGP